MAIAWRAGSSAGGATGQNITVDKPAGVVAGDILIAAVYTENGPSVAGPAGWTWVDFAISYDFTVHVEFFWKRATESEGANYTFTLEFSTYRAVVVGAWSGCLSSGSPFCSGYAVTGGQFTAMSADSITTTAANAVAVIAQGNYGGDNTSVGSTGYVDRVGLVGCELWDKTYASAGSTGTVSDAAWTTNASGQWATFHMALAPETGEVPAVNTPVAVSYVNSATNSATAATTSCVLNKPTNAQQGDTLIAGMIIEVASPTVTAPTGWALVKSGTPTGTSRALRLLVYQYTLQSSDSGTSSWTWTVTTGYEWAGFISAYRNASLGASAISNTNSSAVGAVSPTVTTLGANAMVLAIACNAYGTTWSPPTSPGTYTERVDVRSGTATTNVSITQSELLYAAAGATGTATSTAANADYWVAAHVVLEVCATERAMVGKRPLQVIDSWR